MNSNNFIVKRKKINFNSHYATKRRRVEAKTTGMSLVNIVQSFPIQNKVKLINYINYISTSNQSSLFYLLGKVIYYLESSINNKHSEQLNLLNIFRMLDDKIENYKVNEFVKIYDCASQWPNKSFDRIIEFFMINKDEYIQILPIIDLEAYIQPDIYAAPYSSRVEYSMFLDEIWMITSFAIKRCQKSFEELIEIFKIIRQMGINARAEAWMHVMTTFTNSTDKFKNACILIKNVSLFKLDLQNIVLSFMLKLIDPYDYYYCIETYEKSLIMLDYIRKQKYYGTNNIEFHVLFSFHSAVLKFKCKKYFFKIWDYYINSIIPQSKRKPFSVYEIFRFQHQSKRECLEKCSHDEFNQQ